ITVRIRKRAGSSVVYKLQHANTVAIKKSEYLRIAIHVEAALESKNMSHLATGHYAAHIARGQRQFHLVGVGFQSPVKNFQQPAGMFDGVVVTIVRILEIESVDN